MAYSNLIDNLCNSYIMLARDVSGLKRDARGRSDLNPIHPEASMIYVLCHQWLHFLVTVRPILATLTSEY